MRLAPLLTRTLSTITLALAAACESAAPESAGGTPPTGSTGAGPSGAGDAGTSGPTAHDAGPDARPTPGANDAGASGAVDSGATDAGMPAPPLADASPPSPPVGDAAVDPKLPKEPVIPAACVTLKASRASSNGVISSETNPDTTAIQAAIDACPAGQSVRLSPVPGADAFLSGPIKLAPGVTLWIDTGASLFASRDPREYDVTAGACGTYANNSSGGCKPLIAVTGANSGVMGGGAIEGRGGEPMIGQGTTTWWDVSEGANTAGKSQSCPRLIDVTNAENFTLYGVTLHDSPKFHAVINSKGFVAWGVTIQTPGRPTNSQGKALTAAYARNTDGIDPSGASSGFIVYSKISTGDDHVAIKAGGAGPSSGIVIAHNRFGAGHGMSIGSETNAGVSNIEVYDLSIDGTVPNGNAPASDRNGIRIKSDASRGGAVTNVTYRDVCMRGINNPVLLTPHYTTASGSLIPDFTGVVLRDIHSLVSGSVVPKVTLEGDDASHLLGVTLDNVVVDGLTAADVSASYANITIGPGGANVAPTGTAVNVTTAPATVSPPNGCDGKWTTF